MADTIIVRCYTCGKNLGDITFVPGSQKIGCDYCDGVTLVSITKDGEVYTSCSHVGTLPKRDEE